MPAPTWHPTPAFARSSSRPAPSSATRGICFCRTACSGAHSRKCPRGAPECCRRWICVAESVSGRSEALASLLLLEPRQPSAWRTCSLPSHCCAYADCPGELGLLVPSLVFAIVEGTCWNQILDNRWCW